MKLYNIELLDISNQILQDPTFKKQGSNIPILFHVSNNNNLTKLTPGYIPWYHDGIRQPHMCFSRSLAGVCIGGYMQFNKSDNNSAYLYVIDNRKITAQQLKGHIFKAHDKIPDQGRFSHQVDIDIEVPVVKIGTIYRKKDQRGHHHQILIHGYVKDKQGNIIQLPEQDKSHKKIKTINGDAYLYFSEFMKAAKKIRNDIRNITEDQVRNKKHYEDDKLTIFYYDNHIIRDSYKITDVKYDLIEQLFGKQYAMKFKLHVQKQNKKFILGN